jgi:hypothetical protein
MKPVARDALVLTLVLAATVAAHRPFLALGHLGWDTYPLILTSRIASAADLLGVFREELMDGRHPSGHFYRPVTSLSFALDHAVWGLEATGYHLTDLLLLLACAIGVAALGRRLLGPGIGPLTAALLFALHPLHVETLPVAARRADILAQLFTLLALVAAPGAASGRKSARSEPQASGVHSSLRAGLSALCAALAVGSKESGVAAVPLLLALAFTESGLARGGPDCARRCGDAPAVGGHRAGVAPAHGRARRIAAPGSSLLAGASRGLIAPRFLLLSMPQPLVRTAFAWGSSAPGRPRSPRCAARAGPDHAPPAAHLRRLAAHRPLAHRRLGEIILVCAVPPGLSLIGGLAGRPVAAARPPDGVRGRRRLTVLLLAQALRYSPLLHDYPEWALVSRRSPEDLLRVQAAVEHAAPGDVRSVPGIPLGIATPLGRVGVRSALGIAEYSVEAWAALVAPDPPVAVTRLEAASPRVPRPGAILIETTPDPESSNLP